MDAPPAAVALKPCCVCAAPSGKHCTKCKSRHYCGKACQLVDWYERGHKAQCKQLAAEFPDRLVDSLVPKKIKEAPAIVEDAAPAAGFKARALIAGKAAAAGAPGPSRGTCAICMYLLPVEGGHLTCFLTCCCKMLCTDCAEKCREYDARCPLCRSAAPSSDAENLRRMMKHANAGNAEAQTTVGDKHREGGLGLQKDSFRAIPLYHLAAAQGHARAQFKLGFCYSNGDGIDLNYETAVYWYRRAADQGHPTSQVNYGGMLLNGQGLAQSDAQAVKWFRLAAEQGHPLGLFSLGYCYEYNRGVPRDFHEALRLYKRAAAKGHAGAPDRVANLEKGLAWVSGF